MNRLKNPATLLATSLLNLLALASSASATPVTFIASDDPKGTTANSKAKEAEFLATLGSFGTNDLESFDNNTADPTLTFGATGITAATDVDRVVEFALFSISPTKVILDRGPTKIDGPSMPDVFTFNKAITAFGYFVSNVGDSKNVNTITLRLENVGDGTSKDVVMGTFGPGRGTAAVLFLGVTDTDPFDRVTIIESLDFDGGLIDNITAGYIVPEPGTMGLLAVGGLLTLAFKRARSRRH